MVRNPDDLRDLSDQRSQSPSMERRDVNITRNLTERDLVDLMEGRDVSPSPRSLESKYPRPLMFLYTNVYKNV